MRHFPASFWLIWANNSELICWHLALELPRCCFGYEWHHRYNRTRLRISTKMAPACEIRKLCQLAAISFGIFWLIRTQPFVRKEFLCISQIEFSLSPAEKVQRAISPFRHFGNVAKLKEVKIEFLNRRQQQQKKATRKMFQIPKLCAFLFAELLTCWQRGELVLFCFVFSKGRSEECQLIFVFC